MLYPKKMPLPLPANWLAKLCSSGEEPDLPWQQGPLITPSHGLILAGPFTIL